jgi:nucleoside phosphorylase
MSYGCGVLVIAATERELAHVRGSETFVCGIGPVEAALQTARALAERRPDAVLHVGIAGAVGFPALSVVLGSEAVYCDVIDDSSTLERVERVEPNAELLGRLRLALPDARVLPIATCGKVGGSVGCQVEAMEGFGVLRACALAGVPAVELRVVSNAIGEPDRSKWRFDEAFDVLGACVAQVFERW